MLVYLDANPDCYDGNGETYRGMSSTTIGGDICQNWNLTSEFTSER